MVFLERRCFAPILCVDRSVVPPRQSFRPFGALGDRSGIRTHRPRSAEIEFPRCPRRESVPAPIPSHQTGELHSPPHGLGVLPGSDLARRHAVRHPGCGRSVPHAVPPAPRPARGGECARKKPLAPHGRAQARATGQRSHYLNKFPNQFHLPPCSSALAVSVSFGTTLARYEERIFPALATACANCSLLTRPRSISTMAPPRA